MPPTLPKKTLPKVGNERRWAAVVGRDKSYDGEFVYSVATTGVYCRPSCPSRPAKRENVQYHESFAEAEALGFRPCKRCRPTELSLDDHRDRLIAEACRQIERSEEAPNLDALAAASGLSRYHFHRIFKEATGVTPKEYELAHRRKRVASELRRSATVTRAIYDSGFNSSSRFYAVTAKALGMTPQAFRSGGKETVLRFAVGQSSLGAILVAASDKGISAIMLGDDAGQLVRELQDRFPKAELIGGDRAFERVVARAVGLVEKPAAGLRLPLDVQGTAFQHRVWRELGTIPPGSTATYAEIAKRIGTPRAVRAVARACATNAHAIAIPCHRVVRINGSLAGYRWGIARKQALLKREAAKDQKGGEGQPS